MRNLFMAVFLLCAAFSAACQVRAGELRVARGNEDYPPKEMHVNGKLTGLHVEIIEAVAAKMGHTVVWQELPWARAQKCAERGECDAICYISPSAEREAWGIFLPENVLSQIEMRFMVHKDNTSKITYNGNVSEFLSGRTLLSVIGYHYGPEIAKAQKYEVKDLSTLSTMMAIKRYDVAVISVDDFAGIRNRGELILLEPPFFVSKAFVAFSKNVPGAMALSERFQSALREFRKTREYAGIVHRYKAAEK